MNRKFKYIFLKSIRFYKIIDFINILKKYIKINFKIEYYSLKIKINLNIK